MPGAPAHFPSQPSPLRFHSLHVSDRSFLPRAASPLPASTGQAWIKGGALTSWAWGGSTSRRVSAAPLYHLLPTSASLLLSEPELGGQSVLGFHLPQDTRDLSRRHVAPGEHTAGHRHPRGQPRAGWAHASHALSRAGRCPARTAPVAWSRILGPCPARETRVLAATLGTRGFGLPSRSSHKQEEVPPPHVSSPSSWLSPPDANSQERGKPAHRHSPAGLPSLPPERQGRTLRLPALIPEASAGFGFSAIAASCRRRLSRACAGRQPVSARQGPAGTRAAVTGVSGAAALGA